MNSRWGADLSIRKYNVLIATGRGLEDNFIESFLDYRSKNRMWIKIYLPDAASLFSNQLTE